MPYVAVSVLSHSGLLREGNEDSLVVGPWTLCTTVTENPQTQVFPLGMPSSSPSPTGSADIRAATWPAPWPSAGSHRSVPP